MDGLQRRASGIYVVRLVVPDRLRRVLGKSEFIRSTGTRSLAVAKIVGSECLAAWRRQLYVLGGHDPMEVDLLRVAGKPAIAGAIGDHLPLLKSHDVFGLPSELVLRAALAGSISLFTRLNKVSGYRVPWESLELQPEGGRVVPNSWQMPPSAVQELCVGTFELDESAPFADTLLQGGNATCVALHADSSRLTAFIPDTPLQITSASVEVRTSDLERLRASIAAEIDPHALERLRAEHVVKLANPDESGQRPLRESLRWAQAVEAYMAFRVRECAEDQARRVRAALDLAGEYFGERLIRSISSPELEAYRDSWLPTVPANENKVRLRFQTTSVTESMAAVAGSDWPTISAKEQLKRLEWLASMFSWLARRGYLDRDPAQHLVEDAEARRGAKVQESVVRLSFEPHHLAAIFGEESVGYRTGTGLMTSVGTFRTFLPYYYWLPLIGLFTGARINEISQLHLDDIKTTEQGTWYFEFAPKKGQSGDGKKLKNNHSARQVPIHPWLIDRGLLRWRAVLKGAGHHRLFPELKEDSIKGHGKAASQWFSRFLAGFDWARDGTLTFHSFRSTLITAIYRDQPLLPELTIAQLSGHSRPRGNALREHYLKDMAVDTLREVTDRIRFQLPDVAAFRCEEGLAALGDALRRKNRGRGAGYVPG